MNDREKLKQSLGCLWKTRFLPLMISIDTEGNVCVYIDGFHGVYSDCEGHSGLFLTMGRVAMMNASKKLGLVAKTEIVSVRKRFNRCTWFRHFKLAQGEDQSKDDVLSQDNESSITVHGNFPYSIGKGSKHMRIRCFLL